jgi:hypothetical protein
MCVHLVGLVSENKLIKIHSTISFITDGRKPLGRLKCRRDNDIKINLKELSFEEMDWIICNRDKWYTLLTTIMNLRVAHTVWSFFSC